MELLFCSRWSSFLYVFITLFLIKISLFYKYNYEVFSFMFLSVIHPFSSTFLPVIFLQAVEISSAFTFNFSICHHV